ncbi:MAG: NUDIX hydrolase, partial [Chloroflexota bacterium]|nr:NUDIX hydrolase [Chloroflexota bacterium]
TGTTHVIPGGRREPGESLEDTLTREIREEVGCDIAPGPRPLGFIQLHNRLARRDGSPYPHPDSLWVVYAATALPGDEPSGEDELVRDPRFVEVRSLRALNVSPVELAFVEAALG